MAANFINNVRRTIQANKGVAAANQWFTRNTHKISREGKIVERFASVAGIIFEGYNFYSVYRKKEK